MVKVLTQHWKHLETCGNRISVTLLCCLPSDGMMQGLCRAACPDATAQGVVVPFAFAPEVVYVHILIYNTFYIYIYNLMLCIVMYTVYTIWVRKSARMPENAIVFRIVAS